MSIPPREIKTKKLKDPYLPMIYSMAMKDENLEEEIEIGGSGELSTQTFTAQMDLVGRVLIPAHIRRRLGIYRKAGEVEISVTVREVY